MNKQEQSPGHVSLLKELGGYINFWLGDGTKTYRDPNVYDAIVNSWLGREHLAEGVADIVQNYIPQDGKNILDAGAGSGVLSLALDTRGFRVSAMDIEPQALQALVQKVEERCLDPIKTYQLDFNAAQWPFSAGSFDMVTSLRANRYIRNFPDWLQNVHTVLRDGGVFVLPVFTIDTIPWKAHSQKGIGQKTGYGAVKEAIEVAGFTISADENFPSHQTMNVPFYYIPRLIVAIK